MSRHLLIIGAQRCGTTGLRALLEAHPEITMARPSRPEPKIFMSEELAGRGLDWYRKTYFEHATTEALLGEKSTSYLESGEAAGRAAATLGSAEIVVQLRDPVARAVSNWRFSTAHGLENRPLATALEENLQGPRAWDPALTSVSPYAYLERGRYIDYLEPWLAGFPGRAHVRFLEELVDGWSPVQDLYEALGVDPKFQPPGEVERVNASEGPEPELDAGLVRRLREYFAPSDRRLRGRLNRELPWPAEEA
ncbi:MAG: hypothetical protein GEU93_07135 [Propionibacteriales bacterium]|nr:hypothetical protein [Propionibacteriales bacterium]